MDAAWRQKYLVQSESHYKILHLIICFPLLVFNPAGCLIILQPDSDAVVASHSKEQKKNKNEGMQASASVLFDIMTSHW